MNAKYSDTDIFDYWTQQVRMHGQSQTAPWSDHYVIELEIDQILERLTDGDTVLDVGCANGYSSTRFAAARKIRLRGLDYVPEMIEQARLRALESAKARRASDLFSRRNALRQAQQLAPEHERILALTDTAIMLDFVRNPVWPTGNYPGSSSPPPGISKLQTPSELRSYLLRLGIAYVLFEPHMESISGYAGRLASPAETYLAGPWDYNEMIVSVRSYQNIARLAETSEVQLSNGYQVIKLASP